MFYEKGLPDQYLYAFLKKLNHKGTANLSLQRTTMAFRPLRPLRAIVISFNYHEHFYLNIFALLVASVIWKNKNVNFATFILAGSFIYRDLSKYIRPDRGKAYLIISCSSIFIFMLLILSAVIFES